ncbi:hypothetical protein [Tenacibaculum sp. nBUS_03]|uniref:hypothetical protein n=1 Tax=Tenacibaculum sp. nBUS_03 TaxID=3395320 RepID=UPI003EBE525F
MNTKNKEIERIWEEIKEDNSITIDEYQLAAIFERGYQYHKNTIGDDDLNKLKRNKIISKEIDRCLEDLVLDFWACGINFSTDVFKLSDGRSAQIKIEVTVDVDDFEEGDKAFNL